MGKKNNQDQEPLFTKMATGMFSGAIIGTATIVATVYAIHKKTSESNEKNITISESSGAVEFDNSQGKTSYEIGGRNEGVISLAEHLAVTQEIDKRTITIHGDYFDRSDAEIGESLSIDFDVLKEPKNGDFWRPIRDMDKLSSGQGYQIRFRVNKEKAFVYIFQEDSSGSVFVLHPSDPEFPYSRGRNPVAGGEWSLLPSPEECFFLDNATGIESIFFYVSEFELPNLKELLKPMNRATEKSKEAVNELTRSRRGIAGTKSMDIRSFPDTSLPVENEVKFRTYQTADGVISDEFRFLHVD